MQFGDWVAQHPELPMLTPQLPPIDVIWDLVQLVQHFLRMQEEQERRKRKSLQTYNRLYDRRWGSHSQAHRQIRPASNPCLQEVWQDIHQDFRVLQGQGTGLLTGILAEPLSIPPRAALQLNGVQVTLCQQQGAELDLMLDDADTIFSPPVTLKISIPTLEPTEVGRALHNFWGQYWQRDSLHDTWQDFEQLLEEVPPLAKCDEEITLQDWRQALRKLKPNTAKGVCGWSTEELQSLPDQAIKELHALIGASQAGFPVSMMRARTIPLGKITQPDRPSQTRPITILSLLYRAWGKVCCTKILQHWAATMPSAIVGFLPSRSLTLTMMKFQHALEKTHKGHMPSQGGLTLDLTKAFNLIGRTPAQKSMQHVGVPATWASKWKASIDNMTRSWEINGHVTKPETTTTGSPEGDTWSVLSMISLSYVWICKLQQACSQALRPIAYADNLGWSTVTPQDHAPAIQTTIRWADSLKLQIDWAKTWVWATDSQHVEVWQNIRATTEVPPLHKATNARELGYMLAYNKRHNRFTFKQRLHDGLAQLRKISYLPHDLQTKALLTRSVMSKILFATEIHAIGRQHLEKVRTGLTRAMLGPYTQANPFLAMIALSSHVIDPAIAITLHSIKQTRLLLCQMSTEDREFYMFMVSQSDAQPLACRGPAGALKYNLRQLGWTFHSSGVIHVDGLVTLHLLHSPWDQIVEAVHQAWGEQIPDLISTRKDWRQAPVIDSIITKNVFMKFSDAAQKVIAFEITGAYQTAHQKQKWVPDLPDSCPHCNGEDSVIHRRLLCPALKEARYEHSEMVTQLTEMNPIVINLPVVFQSPWFALDRCLAWKAPPLSPNDRVLAEAMNEAEKGYSPLIFTDGSAAPPQYPTLRTAAYSIVFLPQKWRQEGNRFQEVFLCSHQIPPEFQTLGVARTQGRQTIPRSELQAVCDTMRLLPKAEIVTDSMYVIDAVQQIRSGVTEIQLLNQPNGDILKDMAKQLRMPGKQFILHKVKSHQDLHQTMTAEDVIFALGNEAADQAAKEARTLLADQTRFVRLPDAIEDVHFLEAHYELCVDIGKARVKIEKQKSSPPTDQPQEDRQMFHVEFDHPYSLRWIESDDTWIEFSLWGPGLTKALWTWLRGLTWPREAFEQTQPLNLLSVGITWLELLLDFQQATQIIFPQNIGERGKFLQLVTPTLHDTCHEGDMHMPAMLKAFQSAIAHLTKLSGRTLIPSGRKVVKTLYNLGAGHQPTGISVRPQMWHQDEILRTLTQHYQTNPRSWNFPGILKYKEAPPSLPIEWTMHEKQPRPDEGLLRKQALQTFLRQQRRGN